MDQTKPARLVGTRICLASTKANLADSNTIKWLKENGITKVFCLFPLTPQQFSDMGKNFKDVYSTMQGLYKELGIDPNFAIELTKAGIQVSSLARNPYKLRDYTSFLKEALDTRGSFVIQCFGGQHASAAYAMYYLAKATPYSLREIRDIFVKSGRAKDIARIEEMLADKKIYVNRIVERKMKLIEQARLKLLARQQKKKRMPSRKRK